MKNCIPADEHRAYTYPHEFKYDHQSNILTYDILSMPNKFAKTFIRRHEFMLFCERRIFIGWHLDSVALAPENPQPDKK